MLESLARDLRFSLRQLRQSPGFTLTAILVLALGMCALCFNLYRRDAQCRRADTDEGGNQCNWSFRIQHGKRHAHRLEVGNRVAYRRRAVLLCAERGHLDTRAVACAGCIAFPMLSMAYVVNAVAAWYLLGEAFNPTKLAGTAISFLE